MTNTRWHLSMVIALASIRVWAQADLPVMDCLLEPRQITNVSSAVPGILESIEVRRGDYVSRDTVIARLDSRAENAALDVARARAEFGKRTDVRNEELYRDELISVHEKDASATESLLAQLQYEQSQVMLSMRDIRSPLSGVVVERLKSPGEFVQGDEIVRLAQINPLNVEVVVPIKYLGAIKKGGKAIVRPEAPLGGQGEATVIVVDGVVDAASSTFGVRLSLPNPKNTIPAGLRCTVEFAAPDE